jgi:toxin ParE1/3/4
VNSPVISPEAEADLEEAKAWYDRQRTGLGDEFMLCVEDALDRVLRMPLATAPIFEDVRRVLVRRFPYGVYYKVDADLIVVIAVYHTRRNPRGWQERAND